MIKSSQDNFLGQGILGIKVIKEMLISLSQGDFGDDSPKVPANMKDKTESKINFL
jgi:hypothetical protein